MGLQCSCQGVNFSPCEATSFHFSFFEVRNQFSNCGCYFAQSSTGIFVRFGHPWSFHMKIQDKLSRGTRSLSIARRPNARASPPTRGQFVLANLRGAEGWNVLVAARHRCARPICRKATLSEGVALALRRHAFLALWLESAPPHADSSVFFPAVWNP